MAGAASEGGDLVEERVGAAVVTAVGTAGVVLVEGTAAAMAATVGHLQPERAAYRRTVA